MEDLEIPRVPSSFYEKRESIIMLCKDAMKKDFTRGDYKEVVQLTLLYLDDI